MIDAVTVIAGLAPVQEIIRLDGADIELVAVEGTTAELNASQDPSVRQFMQGSSDGPVSFHYPADDYLTALLDGSDVKLRHARQPAANPAGDAPGAGQP